MLLLWISTRRVEIRWVSAMTIVGTLRPVIAFAMIAFESVKRLGKHMMSACVKLMFATVWLNCCSGLKLNRAQSRDKTQ